MLNCTGTNVRRVNADYSIVRARELLKVFINTLTMLCDVVDNAARRNIVTRFPCEFRVRRGRRGGQVSNGVCIRGKAWISREILWINGDE
jgi:hypothetical protein